MECVKKDTLIELQDNYAKVRKLLDDDSKNDPVTEPYRSKYAASVILTDMKSKLCKILDEAITDENARRFKAMLGSVWLHLGTISVDTEELSTGEEQLLNCVSILSNDAMRRESILALLTALNQLGILWSQRDQPTKSKEYLEMAEKYYKEFVENNSNGCITMYNLFHLDDLEAELPDNEHSLEKTHTLTLYYLAQIYSSLNDHLRAAVYCHTTLKRQLEFKDFDPIDWALNSATLSQYFMEKCGFKQARHHLSAASFILDQYVDLESTEGSSDDSLEAKKERLKHRSADVARCWAKYGLLLLSSSKDRLMQQADRDDEEDSEQPAHQESLHNLITESSVSEEEIDKLWFTSLELSSYEEQITDRYVLTFEEAREVFLKTQTWLNKAKEYYSLDGFASDYVQIVQDHSQLFKVLAFFEENEDRQSRMQKRRVDLLEAVLSELNPQYYLLVCRQLWFELAEVYSDILDIKLQKLQSSDERPTLHSIRKVNNLTTQAIAHFNKFLDSLKDTSTGEMPTQFSDEVMRPALIAYFRIGRLHSKIITADKAVQLENIKSSLDAFSSVVDYCSKHKSAKEHLPLELSVCEDMVKLLPVKLHKLQRELQEQ